MQQTLGMMEQVMVTLTRKLKPKCREKEMKMDVRQWYTVKYLTTDYVGTKQP